MVAIYPPPHFTGTDSGNGICAPLSRLSLMTPLNAAIPRVRCMLPDETRDRWDFEVSIL